MSVTVDTMVAWLKSQDSIRMILVEVEGVDVSGVSTTFYLSSKPYTTLVGETPSGVSYTACIAGGLSFSESIPLDGSASIGYGDISLTNTTGDKDPWINYAWTNRKVSIYMGDPRWPRADFYKLFTGVISDITVSSRNSLNLVILNKLDKLNNPISDKTVVKINPYFEADPTLPVGASQNRESLLPLCFGECFNITPLLISSALSGGGTSELTYMIHDGAIERIIEVRDSGVPLTVTSDYTVNLTNGTFTLLHPPAGEVTCSVQGSKLTGTYSDQILPIIKYIVTNYGPTNSRFTDSDLVANWLTQYTLSQHVGIYINERENIIDVCQKLASSVGGIISCSHEGLLKFVRISFPGQAVATGYVSDIIESNILYDSLVLSEKPIIKGTVKLGYCYAWTQQDSGIAGAVPRDNRDVFKNPYINITKTDPVTVARYILDEQPIEEETLLISEADADAEAQRRLDFWSQPRRIFTFNGTPELLGLEPGHAVTLTNYRYGLSNTAGIVINSDKNWVSGTITLGVLV